MAEIARRIIIENRSNNLYITQRMLYCVGIGDTGMTFLLTPKFATGRFVPVADVIGCRNLRSATRGLLNFPRYNMTSYGRRAFSYAGPHAWNSQPEHLRQTTLIERFKRSLKRFYSGRYRAQRIRDIPVQWAI